MQLSVVLRIFILLLISFVVSPAVSAAAAVTEHNRVFSRFIQLSVPGRTLPVPTTMTQDKQGFLWLGTQHGLYRYDGTDLLEFRANPTQSGSLSASWVSALAVDPQGWLWVGTRYGGLNRFDPATESFRRFDLPAADPSSAEISALIFDAGKQLWVATYGAGLYQWQEERLHPVPLPETESDLAVKFINSLFIDGSGGQWLAIGEAPIRTFGQQRGGVLYRPDVSSEWREIPFINAAAGRISVSRISQGSDGTLWAATYGQGLYQLDPAQFIFQVARQPERLKQALLSDLHLDSEGGIWLSSYNADQRGGLWYRDPQGRWLHYPFHSEFSEGLARSDLLGLFQDQQGILWTVSQSGFRGLSRFARAIRTLPNGQISSGMLAAPNVLGIDAVAADSVWLANREGGVAHFNPLTAELKHWLLPEGPGQPTLVQAVHQDWDGTLYVGTDLGLYKLLPASGEWQSISLQEADEPFVRLLYRDRQQNLWIGTRGQGLYRLNPERDQVLHFRQAEMGAAQIRFEDINNLAEDFLGAIWIGSTDQGVARYQPQTGEVEYWLQHSGSQHGLQLNGIQLILEEQNQQLWIRAGNIKHLVLRDPLQPSKILGFKPYLAEEDQDEALKQAPFFRLLYRLHWLDEQQTYLELNEMHGMQSNTWIGAWDIIDDTIYRGGARGFDYFSVSKLPRRVALNKVQLTALSLFNQPVRAGSSALPQSLANLKQLVLTYEQDMFSIRFASPEFKQAQQIQYRYQLKGFDRDWIHTSALSPVATYTRLPPGDYLFQVAARLTGGQWTPATELSVRVLPPWWLTWWFKLSVLLALVLTIMLVLRWRLRHEYQIRRKLELLVEKRTAQLAEQNKALELSYQRLQQTQQQLITQEKMASLGGLVAGVAHEINTPLGICVTATSHLQSEQAQLAEAFANKTMLQSQFNRFMQHLTEGLKILQVNTQRAADLVNSFKQVSVDQSHDSYREFELCQYLNDVLLSLRSRLKQQQCQLLFDCPEPVLLYSDPGAIAQVMTNLIMNALVHGLEGHPQPKIQISIEDTPGEVWLHFSDNGKGMSEDELRQLFDPFFTTKRHQGGSGLGAHIVYNLVTVRLQGTISVSSQPSQGVHYLLRLPKRVTAEKNRGA